MSSLYSNPAVIFTHKMTVPNQTADISYPVVTGLGNPAAQQKINSDIVALVNRLVAMQVNQLISAGYTTLTLSITGWYEIKTNERNVLSLTIGNYTIATPAAHGLTIVKALTFDTNTGKSYLLSEQFKPGSNYVKVLSDIVKAQIKARGISTLDPFESIKPEQDYYLSDLILVLIFQQYEITPGYYGTVYFPVSTYEITDIIRQDSPLYLVSE